MNTSRLAWALPVPFVCWLVLRTGGWEPTFRWIQLVAFTPYVAAAALVVPVAALLLGNRAAAVAGALAAGLLVWLVAPRAFSDPEPRASGPTLRILGANLLHGRTPPERIAALVKELRIDVLSLEELPPAGIPAMEAALKALLPYSAAGTHDTSLYSRFPLAVRADSPPGSIRADLAVPGAGHPVEFVAVHTCAPLGPGYDTCWQDSQRRLPAATPHETVRVMAGDFNSTLDHALLRRVLDTGYRDAADARGEGLAPTWPADGRVLPPGIAIDHVVADRRVAIRAFATHDLPRSDHRAVSAVLTLP